MLAAVLHGAKDLRLEPLEDRPLAADEVRLAFRAGGICGSDLSYYFKGRVGDFALREPLVLGHEVAGEIVELGAAVEGLRLGDRVAIDPSRPCLACDYCRGGRSNLCRHMRFFGSAAVVPHVQGAFSEHVVARADQCHVIPDAMPWRVAACAEPLAVCLHALERAGELLGRSVVIAGAGPIGCLTVLAARAKGAGQITVTDLVDEPLEVAKACGADQVVNVRDTADRLEAYKSGKGHFDVGIEATGAVPALATLFDVVRAGGVIVQVGMLPPGEVPVPANKLMAREIDYVGAFRFHGEYGRAVRLLGSRRVDIAPILTHDLPLARGQEAFALAADRTRSIKVHVHF
jgi:L-idonate 5-dehydrogenase